MGGDTECGVCILFGCSQNPEKTMTVDEDAIEAVTQLGGLVSAKGRTERKIGNRGSAVTSRF